MNDAQLMGQLYLASQREGVVRRAVIGELVNEWLISGGDPRRVLDPEERSFLDKTASLTRYKEGEKLRIIAQYWREGITEETFDVYETNGRYNVLQHMASTGILVHFPEEINAFLLRDPTPTLEEAIAYRESLRAQRRGVDDLDEDNEDESDEDEIEELSLEETVRAIHIELVRIRRKLNA